MQQLGAGTMAMLAQAAPAQLIPVKAVNHQTPKAFAPAQLAASQHGLSGATSSPNITPIPAYIPGTGGVHPAQHDQPQMPAYAWPSYAASPNYGAVTYPRQYSPTAWPYIGPFYPYPQVPLGWRKVSLRWKDGWWMLDFKDRN